MIYLTENIRYLRRQLGLTQKEMSEKLGIKRSLLGAYEEGRAVPRLLVIQQLSLLFNLTADDLIGKNLSEAKPDELQKPLRILTTVVNEQNEERISIVPVKASAGYLNGLADPEYVAELPHFALPVAELSQGSTYRVFQIKGDSMLPVPPGAYVFCSFVESFSGIRDGKPYIVITADEGIVYKRVFNQLDIDGTLLLKSDNEVYNPYSVQANTVLELWQAIGFLSFELPEPEPLTIDKLSSMVYKMKEDIEKMKKKE